MDNKASIFDLSDEEIRSEGKIIAEKARIIRLLI